MKKTNCKKNAFIGMSGPHTTLVVSVRNPKDKTDSALAVEWSSPLSVNPPLFGIVVSKNKETHNIIREAGVFAVNILSAEDFEKIWWLGTHTGRRHEDKISEIGLTAIEGSFSEHAITIDEAAASFECKLLNEVPVGNFTLFIGEVMATKASDLFFDSEKNMWKPESIKFVFHVANDVFLTNEEMAFQPTS